MNPFIIICLLIPAFSVSVIAETVNPGDMTKSAVRMTDIHDIAGLMPAIGIPAWIIIASSLAALLLFIAAAFLVWKRFRKAGTQTDVPEMTPWDEALKRLDLLSESIGRCSEKEFCFEISEILRRYISRRFSVDAMGMTAEELKPVIERIEEISELKAGIRSLVSRSELVKFSDCDAASVSDKSVMENDIAFLRRIVEMTLP
jgi:hypothetical protein